MTRPDEGLDDSSGTAPPAAAPATSDGPPASGPPADRTGSDPAAGAVQPARTAELADTVAALTGDDIMPAQRRQLLGRLVRAVRARGVGDLFKPRAAIRWIADAVGEITPHIPIRDLDTLRRHHGGLTGEALAERLVRNAAIATAGVGAAGGGVAAVEWVATPTLLSAPVLLAAETVAVVAIEMKLIGELHEVYGAPVDGSATNRAVALMQSWAEQRGVNPMVPGVGMAAVLSTAARKELRDRLLRRFGRNLTTFGPLLTGAAVAGFLNRRATRSLGDRLRADLRRQRRAVPEILPPER
jgi:hypothetical protein